MKIPRVHWILPILRSELFTNCTATVTPNKENNPLGMDENTTTSLRPSESTDVRSTSPNPTQLQEKVLPSS
jgi:hypothetical protein